MNTETAVIRDRIEKQIVLRAPRARVWRALSDAEAFGEWFGVNFKGLSFAPGATLRGKITNPGYEHLTLVLLVERIEPERLFSYRWNPYDFNPDLEQVTEPSTLVEFRLEDAPDGTLLNVVESGFDRGPLGQRAEAWRRNDGGWTEQVKNIEAYVARTS